MTKTAKGENTPPMPYRRKGSKYWWIRYTVNGKRIAESSKTTNYQEAKSLELELRSTAHETFDDLMRIYLRDTKNRERDLYAFKALSGAFSGVRLSTLCHPTINAYKRHRQAKNRTLGTIRKELMVFSSAINHVNREYGWNLKNPIRDCLPKKADGRVRWITRDEANKLILSCDKKAPYLPDMIRLVLNTGMRRGEVLNLRWNQVDLNHRLIHLNPKDQKNRKFGSIPLNRTVTEMLLGYTPLSQWVFQKDGKPIKSIKRSFHTACENAGIEDFRFHDLRHTFASWLIQSGVPIAHVSEAMRHSDIRMTMVYAHLSPDTARDAVEVLDM